jgi:RNA polymerase-binding transcription factor DksA
MKKKKNVDLEPYKAKLRELYEKYKRDYEGLEATGLHENILDVTGDATEVDNHPADSGTEVYMRERDQAMEENLLSILRRCERAMAKIEDGTYGYSDVSGEFIGEERLDAIPYANLTIAEQERTVEG